MCEGIVSFRNICLSDYVAGSRAAILILEWRKLAEDRSNILEPGGQYLDHVLEPIIRETWHTTSHRPKTACYRNCHGSLYQRRIPLLVCRLEIWGSKNRVYPCIVLRTVNHTYDSLVLGVQKEFDPCIRYSSYVPAPSGIKGEG